MGKKSRGKKERKLAQLKGEPKILMREINTLRQRATYRDAHEKAFSTSVEETRALFRQYGRLSAAIALSASELWPANVASPVKHIFAWRVLLALPDSEPEGKGIASYEEFKTFVEALYRTWSAFPTLEDYSPEADWGQIRVRLDGAFVPMFYGGGLERTPDFIEAFRITYADIPEAQAQMNLAVALQARIIEAIPALKGRFLEEPRAGHVEVPPEDYWQACRSVLLQVGSDIAGRRELADGALETRLGNLTEPLTWSEFGNAASQGQALPYLAVEIDGAWVPMSIRSAPSVVIGYWATKKLARASVRTHQSLARFVAERFERTVEGPSTLYIDEVPCEGLPISCIMSAATGVYLICACDYSSISRTAAAAKDAYAKARLGKMIRFGLPGGRGLMLTRDRTNGPSADDLRIVIVFTQEDTTFTSFALPERPTQLLPLGDFITIFDSLEDLKELESYWKYIDSHRSSFAPMFSGPADLYASFKDTHGVLVEGAISPTLIGLDPHWGTSWRFKELAEFWSLAPSIFPVGFAGWQPSKGTTGVIRLESPPRRALAYSTSVGDCTVQAMAKVPDGVKPEDARLLFLFIDLLMDCTYRCSALISDISIYQQPHVLFNCEIAHGSFINKDTPPRPLAEFTKVVTSVRADDVHGGMFYLQFDVSAVLAGLNASKDGSFEVRCLVEALRSCLAVHGQVLPSDFEERLRPRASEDARYHLNVMARNVDVPDHVDPVIASPADYKNARKHLAAEIRALGLIPGRYELSEAKLLICIEN